MVCKYIILPLLCFDDSEEKIGVYYRIMNLQIASRQCNRFHLPVLFISLNILFVSNTEHLSVKIVVH